MARKHKHPEHVNHERWLISYADFITLLFAFFTTLYAISTVDAKKAGKMVLSMRVAFDDNFFYTDKPILGADSNEPPPIVPNSIAPRIRPVRIQGIPPSRGSGYGRTKKLAAGVAAVAIRKQLGDLVTIRREARGMVISLDAGGFFANGSADLTPKARSVLNEISELLLQASLPLRVEGHTDNTPLKSKRFRSNWDLSAARASSVVQLLIDKHAYPSNLLSVGGYGDTRPLHDNDTPEHRNLNRRVDIVVLRDVSPPPTVHTDFNDALTGTTEDEDE